MSSGSSTTRYDLVVVGAGSGGLGAAITAARFGLSVLLIERSDELGGSATRGGVHTWEAGVGGTGLPFDIYLRLLQLPQAVGIYSIGRHFCWQDAWYWPHALERVNFPGGENLIDPARRYPDTLRRHLPPDMTGMPEAFCRAAWHGVTFEPAAYARVVAEMLAETGCCSLRLQTTITGVEVSQGLLQSARLDDGTVVRAPAWIDGTGEAAFARACGAATLLGRDPRSRFAEAGAPREAALQVNGVSLIYRVTPVDTPAIEPLPADIPATCWWASAFPPICCNQYPNGDRNCNMLPSMDGEEYLRLGETAAAAECRRRVRAHWHFLQTHFPEFRAFRLAWTAPQLGMREGRRIVAEYMLTEHDLLRGIDTAALPDIIAIADHARDRHGSDGECPEVPAPYGIPYRALIPRGFHNLLVACRGAGFSAIAASSARLSRTMLALGQAAGTAAALAREGQCMLPDVPTESLRAALRAQRVQLEWPMPEALLHELQRAETGRTTPGLGSGRARSCRCYTNDMSVTSRRSPAER